jgi:phytoene dehydrogenase-like protein
MAGLAAGIRLAHFGKRVIVLERHNAPGGLNSFYFQAGRKFDVGLHAVTNFPNRNAKRGPLLKLLRQLRIPLDALDLAPQVGSRVAFPDCDLRFGNGIELLESEVADRFPGQIDGFRELRAAVLDYDALDLDAPQIDTRPILEKHLSEPLLREMLLCPLMFYGSAREEDMDFDQFVTLWRALYEEGFGRPLNGVRVIIRALLDRYRELGGERRMKTGVKSILIDAGTARGVELENGEVLEARHVISTIGRPETAVLCGEARSSEQVQDFVSQLSFAETISVLDTQPAELGAPETIIFFNDRPTFTYRASALPVDLRSGVICFPNNYQYGEARQLPEGLMRVTSMANPAYWNGLEEADYVKEKASAFTHITQAALAFLPGVDANRLEAATVHRDMFTPRTIEHFTGHFCGAVYGSPHKLRTGMTGIGGLTLAGTDQGFLGIVGAMLSGVSMANRHVLAAEL